MEMYSDARLQKSPQVLIIAEGGAIKKPPGFSSLNKNKTIFSIGFPIRFPFVFMVFPISQRVSWVFGPPIKLDFSLKAINTRLFSLPGLENREIPFTVWSFFSSSDQKHTRNNCRNEEISRRRYQKRICLYETDWCKLRYDKATTIHFDDFS